MVANPLPAVKTGSQPVRVLVVDDSAFMRYTISSQLSGYPEIQVVACARHGEEALELIPKLNPDVITLDVEMPHMDGLTTLRHIMARFPRPVIMVSSLTQEGAVETIQALTLGAVDFVSKPAQKANIKVVMDSVAQKILVAARAKVRVEPLSSVSTMPASAAALAGMAASLSASKMTRPRGRNTPIVLIGSSTGGPKALNLLIPALPENLPAAVVVVQHMPAGFTRSLAERLNAASALMVKEANPGDSLEIGKVLLAPGGFHLTFNERGQAQLNQSAPVHGVRPAVDVTLASLVQNFNQAVIAVILTGMGNDGTNGSMLLHSLGGRVIVEAESSCVVWGMPRSVIEAGVADWVAPLPEIPSAIEQVVRGHIRRSE
jgi:two-component system, chemotaxis family, protein-glutamate methylesterase/glutaminase